VEECRVDGNLSVGRAFGDYLYKGNEKLGQVEQAVVSLPVTTIVKRDSEKDRFIIVACDGIWDCLSNEECCEQLKVLFQKKTKQR